MKKADVYFTSFRTSVGYSLTQKLRTLLQAAGIAELPLKGSYTAIKMHFGERGNLAFLRPNYARIVAETVRYLGGKPFLCDCSTLYVGSRKDALEHLETAAINGFSPVSAGCQILIGDGLRGTDDVELPVPGGKLLKTARIGRVIADSDVIISLSHFKCHELAGIGGALKNLGMGCASRAGKKAQHSDGIVSVNPESCIGCGRCAGICAHGSPEIKKGKAQIRKTRCVGCGRCIGICPQDAIGPMWGNQAAGRLDRKIAETAAAVLNGKPSFHISLVIDVSPFCDCHDENDVPIVGDVGMFASFDPVALDQACADAVNALPINPASRIGKQAGRDCDRFCAANPGSDWTLQLIAGEELNLGTRKYRLIEVDSVMRKPLSQARKRGEER